MLKIPFISITSNAITIMIRTNTITTIRITAENTITISINIIIRSINPTTTVITIITIITMPTIIITPTAMATTSILNIVTVTHWDVHVRQVNWFKSPLAVLVQGYIIPCFMRVVEEFDQQLQQCSSRELQVY